MPLTRSFKDTVKARAARDPIFRDALMIEAIDQFFAGDLNTHKAVLSDYINTTTDFGHLTAETVDLSKNYKIISRGDRS